MADDYDHYNSSINTYDSPKKFDSSLSCDLLEDFQRIRISALRKAAEISPLIKEVTIGPNSPINKVQESPNEDIKTNTAKIHHKREDESTNNDVQYLVAKKQYESKLQENSEIMCKNLIDKMIMNYAETMKQYWIKQTENSERRASEYQARKLQMLKALQESDNLSVLEKVKQDEQNCQYINMKTIESMKQLLEEQNKAAARCASITDSHTQICLFYNEIVNILHVDEYAKRIREKYITSINTVINNINNVMELCKSGNITDQEVKQAEVLVHNMKNVKTKMSDECSELKQIDMLQKQQEEEARKREVEQNDKMKKELEEKKNLEQIMQKEIRSSEINSRTKPLFYSSTNIAHYEELKTFLLNYESQYKDLLESKEFRKYRFDCQKAVNTPVNALSSVSGLHMRDKCIKLTKLLCGEKVQVLDTFIQASLHPQGLPYCTALLAKKIVRQGDLLVSSNPEAAFALASLTVAIWAQFPDFGKLLEANFHRECPYLVPMFLPQREGQSDKEFYKSRGYTYTDDDVVEKQDKFLKRMSGIFRLRCAIWITKPPKFLKVADPQGLRHGWQWLASFINLKPEPDICATLLHDFFTVCGAECFKHYGIQFTKIISIISTDYLTILEKIDEGGPKTRLEVLLQNILQSGYIAPPLGLISPSTI